MKRFIAFICALVLICSIAAVTYAAFCNHQWEWQWTGRYGQYTKATKYVSHDTFNGMGHYHMTDYWQRVVKHYKCVFCNATSEVTEYDVPRGDEYCPYR